MKNVLLIVGLISVLAFTSTEEKNLAKVNQKNGLYVFVDSKPVAEYTNLGTVKALVGITGLGYVDLREKLLDRAKKNYPYADAVILRLSTTGSQNYADVIKFK